MLLNRIGTEPKIYVQPLKFQNRDELLKVWVLQHQCQGDFLSPAEGFLFAECKHFSELGFFANT